MYQPTSQSANQPTVGVVGAVGAVGVVEAVSVVVYQVVVYTGEVWAPRVKFNGMFGSSPGDVKTPPPPGDKGSAIMSRMRPFQRVHNIIWQRGRGDGLRVRARASASARVRARARASVRVSARVRVRAHGCSR